MNYGLLPKLTKDYILSKISEEQIFEHYLGIKVQFDTLLIAPSVIRSRDHRPTCSFYYSSNGKLRFRDFAGYFWGDAFDIVAFINRLNSRDKKDFGIILDIIARDFRLHKYEGKIEIASGSTYDVRDTNFKVAIPKKKIKFEIKKREWNQLDARFWIQGNITKRILDRYEIHPAQYIWKNGDLVYTYNTKDPAYVYAFGDGNFKIYFPYRKDWRFLSNCSVLQGFKQIMPDRIGIITKSYKDVASLASFNLQAVAPSSETTLITKDEWFTLKNTCEHWFSLMDYDRTGIIMAKKLRKEYGIHPLFFAKDKYKSLAKNYIDFGVKDFFEFVTKFGKDETSKLIDNTINKFEKQFERLDQYYYNNLNFIYANNP